MAHPEEDSALAKDVYTFSVLKLRFSDSLACGVCFFDHRCLSIHNRVCVGGVLLAICFNGVEPGLCRVRGNAYFMGGLSTFVGFHPSLVQVSTGRSLGILSKGALGRAATHSVSFWERPTESHFKDLAL